MTRRAVPALLLVAVIATVVAPLSRPGGARAAGPIVVQDELEEVTARIDELAGQVSNMEGERTAAADEVLATQARLDGLLVEKGVAEARLVEVQGEVRVTQIELNGLRNDLRETYIHLERTRAGLAESETAARQLIRDTYMAAGEGGSSFALDVAQINDVSLGIAYLSRVSQRTDLIILQLEAFRQQEERQEALLQEAEGEVEAEADELAALEDRAADVVDEVAAREADVTAELGHQQALVGQIDGEIAEIEGEIATLEKEQERIKAAILAATPDEGSSGPVASGGSGWYRPVPGPISSGFGPRVHPILGYTRMHTGLDMSAGYGEPIYATAAGTVILAGWNGGYGNTVVIDHGGGVSSLYAHQSSLGVSVGNQVSGGNVIGYIGSTGLSTGPHLHFEVRVNGVPVDPVPYL